MTRHGRHHQRVRRCRHRPSAGRKLRRCDHRTFRRLPLLHRARRTGRYAGDADGPHADRPQSAAASASSSRRPGLADPAPVMQAIMGNPVIAAELRARRRRHRRRCGQRRCRRSTITRKRAKQVAVADRLIISKSTHGRCCGIAALEARLRALNPRAPIDRWRQRRGRHVPRILVNGLYDPGDEDCRCRPLAAGRRCADAHDHASTTIMSTIMITVTTIITAMRIRIP